MRKALAALCCTLCLTASTHLNWHRHAHTDIKKHKLAAIAVSRTSDTLIIINLRAVHTGQRWTLPLAGNTLPPGLTVRTVLAHPGDPPPWLGPAGLKNWQAAPSSKGALPGSASPSFSRKRQHDSLELPDIGDGTAYAQLSLGRACRTIAHCNWLGVRAIRESVPRLAIRPFRTALKLATRQNNEYMKRISYYNLAMAYWWMKHYKQAAAWGQKGLLVQSRNSPAKVMHASAAGAQQQAKASPGKPAISLWPGILRKFKDAG